MTKGIGNKISRRDFIRYGVFASLAGSLPLSSLLTGCKKRNEIEKPDIFLITVDTLRADRLGCYGYRRNTSPNIDAFAKDAMLFENCISHAPDTITSFSSIFSGFLPHETQILTSRQNSENIQTLAEILQGAGYHTIAVTSNYVLKKGNGWEQGFLTYDDEMNAYEAVRNWPERTAEETSDRAIEILGRHYDKPLFMWIHYQDPHGPYTPPESYKTMFACDDNTRTPRNVPVNVSLSGRGGIPSYQRLGGNTDFDYYASRYDGEIRYQDNAFKRLIDKLKQLGLYDTSMIFFSSDHGEGMGEHDYYFAHGEYLYQHQIHVPLILKFGDIYKGRRPDFVQHVDILPTILDTIGKTPDDKLRGHNLGLKHQKREIVSEVNSPLVKDGQKKSIIIDSLKLIYTQLGDQYELYDLKKDAFEKNNLVDRVEYKEQYEYLKKRLHVIVQEDRLKLSAPQSAPKLSPEEKKKLESLGYLR